MGNTTSTNTIEEAIASTMNVYTNNTINCAGQTGNSQTYAADGAKGATVSGLNLKQTAVSKLKCMQSTKISNDIQNKVDQQLTQAAASMSQSLNLNPGDTSANNMISNSVTLATDITNTVTMNCVPKTLNTIDVEAKSKDGVATIKDITADQTASLLANCVQSATVDNKALNDIKTQTDQTAKAVEQSVAGVLYAIAAIIVALGILFLAGGGTIVKIIVVCIIFGMVALGITYIVKKGPFSKSVSDEVAKNNKQSSGGRMTPPEKADQYTIPLGKPTSTTPPAYPMKAAVVRAVKNFKINEHGYGTDPQAASHWNVIRRYVFWYAGNELTDSDVADNVITRNRQDFAGGDWKNPTQKMATDFIGKAAAHINVPTKAKVNKK